MAKIIKYISLDILKNRTIVFYAVMLSVLSWTALGLEDNVTKATLTVLNIILFSVPLFSILFSTIYLYNSNEFIELLMSQPESRNKIWNSLFVSLSLSMMCAFLLGAGLPILLLTDLFPAFLLLLTGALITLVFVSLAFLVSVFFRDKSKGVGISILIWLFFALIYDGLLLFLLFQFSDYPIEKIMVLLSALSPVDIARILILLQLDVSAMLGYSGALFKELFGQTGGVWLAFFVLVFWIGFPYLISIWKFGRKDI